MGAKAKAWGTTKTTISNPFTEVHDILVTADGHCSWHHHERKWNAFIVMEGLLTIETKGTTDGYTALELSPGQCCEIPPGVEHRFFNYSGLDARGLEVYWPAGLGEDIVRSSRGGH